MDSLLFWMIAGPGAALLALFFYAFWVEPAWRLRVVRWPVTLPGWTGAPVRLVVISDLHAGAPHIPLRRISRIVRRANALAPDIAVLLGDYGAAHPFIYPAMSKADIAARLSAFEGRLGRYAVLGNHDWWQDPEANCSTSMPEAGRALRAEGIEMLTNEAVRIDLPEGGHFWLAGLGDQRPFDAGPDGEGFDDLEAALSQVEDDAPLVLLAHEPDIFPKAPERVGLVLSGHTHGGQARMFGMSPLIRASENEIYSWGHYRDGGKQMVISGGIGCSVLPVRFRMVPELTVIEIFGQ